MAAALGLVLSGAAGLTVAVEVGVGVGVAGAEEPAAIGWWTSAQISGVPVGAASFVPEGGLQVASGSQGPVSIAALRIAAPEGTTVALTLHLEVGSTAETATVVACPITAAWDPVRAGALTDAPEWDCAAAQATATVDADTALLSLTLPPAFERDGIVDVMLLPIQDSAPFNVTTAAPGPDAVAIGDGPTPPPATPAPDPSATPDGSTDAFVAPSFDGGFTPPPLGPDGTVALPEVAAPTSELPAGLPTRPASRPSAELVGAADEHRGRVVGVAMLLSAALAALAIRFASTHTSGAALAGPPTRGVGRFARPRDDAPPAI